MIYLNIFELPFLRNPVDEIVNNSGLSYEKAKIVYEYIIFHSDLIRHHQIEATFTLHKNTRISQLNHALPCSLLIKGNPEKITFVLRVLSDDTKKILGIGGSKIVYRAVEFKIDANHHISFNRHVVDAVIKDNFDSARREIQIISDLTSDSEFNLRIVPIDAVAEYEKIGRERIRMILPLCESKLSELESLMDKQNLTPIEKLCKRIQVARELAETMHYIHKRGYIHCDAKPDNILLSDGHPVFIDFGLANPIENPVIECKGSTPYIAPETLNKEETSILSDLWNLGIVFYYLFIFAPKKEGSEKFIPGFIKKSDDSLPILLSIAELRDKKIEQDLERHIGTEEEKLVFSLIRNMLKLNKNQRFPLPKIIEILGEIESKCVNLIDESTK